MSTYAKNAFQLSRPRFRLYTTGPYLVGVAASGWFAHPMSEVSSVMIGVFVLYLLFFLFPANLLIYGVNDIYDTDTDAVNPKKGTYEHQYDNNDSRKITRSIIFSHLLIHAAAISIVDFGEFMTVIISSLTSIVLWITFYLTSIFYSAKPIRAKARPFLDAFFNVLYIIPALIGYTMFGGSWESISRLAFIAGRCWCMAMHTYSAIPDIQADNEVGVTTTAVYLGKEGALIRCGLLWLIGAVLAFPYLGLLSCIIGAIYAGMTILSFTQPVFKLYTRFPRINGLIGFLLFWRIVLII